MKVSDRTKSYDEITETDPGALRPTSRYDSSISGFDRVWRCPYTASTFVLSLPATAYKCLPEAASGVQV